jgi:hypothetical protein
MPITFQGAPYPADPARLTVDNNFTTRPTSSGVGTLSANSLVTRTDVDSRYSSLEVYRLLLTSNTSAPDNISVNSTQSLVLPAGQYMFDAIVVAETTSTTAGLNAVFNFSDNSFHDFQCVFRVMTFPQSSFNVARGLQEIALRNGSQILPDVAVCFFDGGTNNLTSSSKTNGIVTLSASKTVVGQVRQRMATNATVMVSGRQYKIQTVGTTDYTLVGSPNNTVGTVFTATGPATGTGTVWDFDRPAILRAGSYIEFRRIA